MSSDLILRWTSAYNDQMISFFLTRFLFTDLVMTFLAILEMWFEFENILMIFSVGLFKVVRVFKCIGQLWGAVTLREVVVSSTQI